MRCTKNRLPLLRVLLRRLLEAITGNGGVQYSDYIYIYIPWEISFYYYVLVYIHEPNMSKQHTYTMYVHGSRQANASYT